MKILNGKNEIITMTVIQQKVKSLSVEGLLISIYSYAVLCLVNRQLVFTGKSYNNYNRIYIIPAMLNGGIVL